ncbi:MAG: thiamine-phosphate kinase [Hyphomonadaceae bacterium]|nr:thiamine-phosphate kinase [Hyphomonadaceae bacterium]
MNEFEFIQKHLSGLAGPQGLGLLDDAAQWSPPRGLEAIISTDTLVEGVHFPDKKFDAQLAQKLIRVNISDIIAKGADPIGYMLSLSLNEKVSEANIFAFCSGLAIDQQEYGLKLWGGDTTRTPGPNVLTITIFGTTPTGKMVARAGAQPGDLLCVSGYIGEAYLGLKTHLKQMDTGKFEAECAQWLAKYHVPQPAFELRHGIQQLASAALDISDGLVADAEHLAKASNVKLLIDIENIPVSDETRTWLRTQSDQNMAKVQLATGGDDYQILAAVNPNNFDKIRAISKDCGIQFTKIGRIEQGAGVLVLDKNGNEITVDQPGYTHF